MVVTVGIEPTLAEYGTAALPLGYVTLWICNSEGPNRTDLRLSPLGYEPS